ncbi:MAG: hypothetical protein HY725_08895 [Candidatus Rokubacteria bacterium]|nr:hypothetical protein [Candidatus Rokubacteria bacterium]
MAEPTLPAAEVTTIFLICPVWGQMAEVTALYGRRGFVSVVGCPLSPPGSGCAAPCEELVRRWCEYAA